MTSRTLIFLFLLVAALAFAAASAQEAAAPAADTPAQAGESLGDVAAQIAEETNVPLLIQVALTARERGDFAIMELAGKRLRFLRPQVSQLAMILVRAYALQDKKSKAYDLLLAMENQGVAVDLMQIPDLENISSTEVFHYLVHSFEANAEPIGNPEFVARLPRKDLLADSLTWDPLGETLLVGSVTQGAVYRLAEDGTLTPFIEADEDNGLLAVFDMLADAERDALWVTSNAVPHFSKARFQDVGRAGIWKFRLSTGEYLTRFEAPRNGEFLLTDLALGPEGTVYALNGKTPEIIRIDAEERELKNFLKAPSFTGFRALTVDERNRMLVADYELGLFGISVAQRKMTPVTVPKTVNVGGIDDMVLRDNQLFVVQNALAPMRVSRVELTPDGLAVVKSESLLSGLAELQSPAAATLVGDRFQVLSASHWNLYDPQTGKPRDAERLTAPAVLATAIDAMPQGPTELFDPEEAKKKYSYGKGRSGTE